MRNHGVVKWFNDKTGFGFITDVDDGTEYWVHWTGINIPEKFKKLKEGEKVTFALGSNDKGSIAIDVRREEEQS